MTGEVFLSSVKKLTEQNLTVGELIGAAENLKAAGEVDLAVQLYKLWLQINPNDPLLYVASFNQSVLLTTTGDLAGAKQALERVLAFKPDFFPAHINLGGILERLGDTGAAVSQWMNVTNKLAMVTRDAIQHKIIALNQMGRILEMRGFISNTENLLRQSLEMHQDQPEIIQHFVGLRLGQCEWPVMSSCEGVEAEVLMKGISPLSMAAYTDDPMLQLSSAWNHNKNFIGYPSADLREERHAVPADLPGRRRIGYLSSDMRNHAVGYIMAEIFEFHDRSEFEIFIYNCGVAVQEPLQNKIKASVEHWVDVGSMDDHAVARRIIADGIDILIDVNGYTKDARTGALALRPAPVIVNWLGYPGSMGSPYHHYIIADDWIIPQDHEIYYSEKVARLPCYQPNDRKRVISPVRPTRQDAKLPEHATVFCCFNGTQKISRFTFERWVTILERVPDSVLWLLSGSEETNKHLQNMAGQRGIAPERFIFADRVSNPDHLARYPLADLFLDTSPYGAHVTASDALWAGVPILTLSGRGFASRVCGSLTRAAGLPELVCTTPEEYIDRAVALGTNKAEIQRLKERLAAGRGTCVLFDTDLLVRRLETSYKQMWNEFRQGRLPGPDLTNLDVYLEAGCEEDHDAVEVLAIKDYHARYKARLARRHRYCPIPADRRLWTAADISEIERDLERTVDEDSHSDIIQPPLRVVGLR